MDHSYNFPLRGGKHTLWEVSDAELTLCLSELDLLYPNSEIEVQRVDREACEERRSSIPSPLRCCLPVYEGQHGLGVSMPATGCQR